MLMSTHDPKRPLANPARRETFATFYKTERMRFLKWAATTLAGHLVLWQIVFSIPLFIVLLWFEIDDGRLTLFQAIYDAVLVSAGGVVVAVLIWYMLTSPLLQRLKKDR